MGLILTRTNGYAGRLRLSGNTGRMSIYTAPGSSFDPDAQLFITNAAITEPVQQTAINSLVVNLKGYGIWTKMNAIYPFVGGTASQHKFNLKDPRDLDAAYRLVFNGGWVHSSNGITGNGTNTFADTKLNYTTLNSAHQSLYSRSNVVETSTSYDMGAYNVSWQILSLYTIGGLFIGGFNSDSQPRASLPNSSGLFINNRTAAAAANLWRNGGKLIQSTQGVGSIPNLNTYIGAVNSGGSALGVASKNYAFSSIGDGLTDTEATNYYTAVQTFQTTLGRQVGVPIVSDPDAQAFLDAAVITDTTQATAVNTLVTDLKGYGVWTKMKALYPFVGGTATTHKFNLKNPLDTDAAFRLVFSGGWTHSSTGALPNGTNAYADTFYTPFANGLKDSAHIGYYSRTNISAGSAIDMGSLTAAPGYYHHMHIRQPGDLMYGLINTDSAASLSNSITQGLFIASRITSTTTSLYRNSTNLGTVSLTSTATYPNLKIYIGAGNNANVASQFSSKETAFNSIGDGLSATEATNYYTAVQTFQTTLGRQV